MKDDLALGVKENKRSRVYMTFFLGRRFLLALTLVGFSKIYFQLPLFQAANIGYALYLIFCKPFKQSIYNFVALVNEATMIMCTFLMFTFIEGEQNPIIGWVIVTLFLINLLGFVFLLGTIYEGYWVWKYFKGSNEVEP